MPAEWERQEGMWLSWPKDPITFPKRVRKVEETYCRMIRQLSRVEKVFLLVDDEGMRLRVRRLLEKAGVDLCNVVFHAVPTVDVWMRDYGPNFVVREGKAGKELAFNHWRFNAWGGKYEELIEDTHVPEKLKIPGVTRVFKPGIVMEGGSLDVNGKGLCLTTRQCLLNKNRNPHLSQTQIEQHLKDHLNLQEVIWLNEGVEGDDTDGHVDDIARFVSEDAVVCAYEENTKDKNHAPLRENLELLKARFATVITLPMPDPVKGSGARLPASYANFLIANDCVLVPLFGGKKDKTVLGILGELFPGRVAAGIDCRDLIWGMGTLHCVSQQQPAV